jgi:hypothetical protein
VAASRGLSVRRSYNGRQSREHLLRVEADTAGGSGRALRSVEVRGSVVLGSAVLDIGTKRPPSYHCLLDTKDAALFARAD